MAARPFSASRGNSLSRSQRAAFGVSSAAAKRRTASRISSSGPDIRHRVMAEQVPLLSVALGNAVDAPPPHLEEARGVEERTNDAGVHIGPGELDVRSF